jgi:hypothetical protein
MKKIILFTIGFIFMVATTVSMILFSLHQLTINGGI